MCLNQEMLGTVEILALTIGLVLGVTTIGAFVCYKSRMVQSYFTDDRVFFIKKWSYIGGIALVNAAMCVMVYYLKNVQVLLYVILALKAKDIIISLIFTGNMLVYRLFKKTATDDVQSKKILAFVPYYKESFEQVSKTVDSIINCQTGTNDKVICVISDGMKMYEELFTSIEQTTDGYYQSWKNETVHIKLYYGFRNDQQMIVMHKIKNMGKKDSIILVNDLFNVARSKLPQMNATLRKDITENFTGEFDYMFSTDADTTIESTSIMKMLNEIKSRDAVAACGVLNANGKGYFWEMIQDFQYMYGQYVRRSTEDVLNQVTCLPGCISMFKLGEHNKNALDMYAEMPDAKDFVRSNVQYIGTDRRYTSCLIYTNQSNKIVWTDGAQAYTDVPNTWGDYIAQRKRWMSNMYFNMMLNMCGKNINWMTRIFCFLDILKLSLVYFRVFNTLFFIVLLATSGTTKTIVDMVPYVVVVSYPLVVFFVYALVNGHLRAKWLRLFAAWLMNKVFVLVSTCIVFTIMLANIGNDVWNKSKPEEMQNKRWSDSTQESV